MTQVGYHLRLPLAELRAGPPPRGRAGCSPAGEMSVVGGPGRLPVLEFTDRVVVTLVYLRLAIPHEAPAMVFGACLPY